MYAQAIHLNIHKYQSNLKSEGSNYKQNNIKKINFLLLRLISYKIYGMKITQCAVDELFHNARFQFTSTTLPCD